MVFSSCNAAIVETLAANLSLFLSGNNIFDDNTVAYEDPEVRPIGPCDSSNYLMLQSPDLYITASGGCTLRF